MIEMVAVMALIGLLLSMAAIAFRSWTRTGGIRSAEAQLLGGLAAARELALTRRAEARFSAANLTDRGAYSLAVGTNGFYRLIGPTNVFARGVRFSSDSVGDIRFGPDGSGIGEGWASAYQRRLVVYEAQRPGGLAFTVIVHRLTGYTHQAGGQ